MVKNYFLSIYYVVVTLLHAEDTALNKMDKNSYRVELILLVSG